MASKHPKKDKKKNRRLLFIRHKNRMVRQVLGAGR